MSAPWTVPLVHRPRNLHIFSAQGEYLGELYWMCEQFMELPVGVGSWRLHKLKGAKWDQIGRLVPRNSVAVTQGRYVVLGEHSQPMAVSLSAEEPIRRAQTHFSRDNSRCTITGAVGSVTNPRLGLRAAHVFPVGRHGQWVADGFQNLVNDSTPARQIAPDKMFSAQNGLTLRSDVHDFFDSFYFAINTDRGYQTVVFEQDDQNFGGRVLDASTRTGAADHRVNDECLRWHYRQAVLTHMRGAGERPWDYYDDFEGDVISIMELPDAGEILEAEFANRLEPYIDVS
ncbi:hypothetical protein BDV19DRAFT_378811 [Aspergillus venezuelensis]